ncbi:protein FATTY ACID EXPORT 3, chloroplastic isoform X2 [Cicer arietinum]|uniref:Protein FATTY ACID EXPORT 3, chloroplastic isoform X2 n=1 Tax=Cicer arietinum TaxID=3827 RepID=A0A3Q7XWY3_CICAR|nr:protein FATTY ACID EXPORT 3, chloroplastic isoform X2 [Cicer arietinum]XP_027188591.1 protein FATTY ACID EXPORT 3, chloroplastic isoform X2 [Cicer arietinum]
MASMSFAMDSVSVLNPKFISPPFNKLPHSPKFHPLLKNRTFKLSVNSLSNNSFFVTPNLRKPLTVAFVAPQHDSVSPKDQGEVEVEKGTDVGYDEESQEAWKQALDTFKEQALKLQGVSQEAYELYSKKAIVVLKDTSEQLKIQADKARHDLSEVAKEITEEGKEYLSAATENSPDVKEIVETFTSPDDDLSLNNVSGVRDFYVGIPYGLILSLGGFLSFMVTGSIAAIRFGVILGGVLLALSISSLKSYKKGQPSSLALKGQTAIASILFLREISSIGRGSTYFTALISGAVAAFYVYRLVLERKPQNGSNLEGEAGN